MQISDLSAHLLGYGIDTLAHVELGSVKLPDSKQSDVLKNCVLLPYALIDKLRADEEVRQCLFIDFKERIRRECRNGVRVTFLNKVAPNPIEWESPRMRSRLRILSEVGQDNEDKNAKIRDSEK